MKFLLVLIILFFVKYPKAQNFNINKQLGYYHHGKIDFGYDTLITHHLKFNDKTVHLIRSYPNGNKHYEFYKFGDTTFVYKEYYETPKVIVDNFWGETTWDLKKEGLVYISDSTLNDTITLFDPETFEAFKYLDTLLLPIGKWEFYNPNGSLHQTAYFSTKGRTGKWEIYKRGKAFSYPQINQIITYKNDSIFKDSLINRVLEKNIEKTAESLKGIWIFYDPKHNGGYEIDSNFLHMVKIEAMMGIGDIYQFLDNQKIYFLKTDVYKTEYKKEEKKGLVIKRHTNIVDELWEEWTLLDFETLEITFRNEIRTYKIGYLSEREISLEKIK
ncbi:hypothetical protein [Aureispira anguillae]|uniref:Uncharacterized protein n=1 Tax=Aureispira anguillae TaxID=2864201 RepID=A0A916DRW9_9BACT|nr:hypothetical protein [Aureispira anguillae]BDS11526.1 hypothetical protein AsAng_0022400 [Aureispira anguillae]